MEYLVRLHRIELFWEDQLKPYYRPDFQEVIDKLLQKG
jgi:hypothetical protein